VLYWQGFASRCVDENFLIHTTIGNRHNPVFAATVFPHDTVNQTAVGVTLWVDHTNILTSGHSGENLAQVVIVLGHIFPFVFLDSTLFFLFVNTDQ
jgi:hypothetical protein